MAREDVEYRVNLRDQFINGLLQFVAANIYLDNLDSHMILEVLRYVFVAVHAQRLSELRNVRTLSPEATGYAVMFIASLSVLARQKGTPV